MIKVECIKERALSPIEKIGSIFYLNPKSIFSDEEGNWYGTIYQLQENDDLIFVEIATVNLLRYKCVR